MKVKVSLEKTELLGYITLPSCIRISTENNYITITLNPNVAHFVDTGKVMKFIVNALKDITKEKVCQINKCIVIKSKISFIKAENNGETIKWGICETSIKEDTFYTSLSDLKAIKEALK